MTDRDPPEDPKTPDAGAALLASRPLSAPVSGTIRLEADALQTYIKQQKLKGSLLVIAGLSADIGTQLVIEEQVLIGREASGIQLNDGGISRNHALVEQRDKQYFLRDMGSTNGTLVNGVRLQGEHLLREGDKIFLSQTVIKFTLVDETEAAYLKQVEHLVGTDDLTGLMSKHRFDASYKEALRVACSSGAPLAALMMDMDGLKAVNDRYGHTYGAGTIAQVGRLIGTALAGRGKACRFGGDEFSAFIPGADVQLARLIAEQIRSGVEELRVFPEHPQLKVTISIGYAVRAPELSDGAALFERADQALYRAKAKGKNTVSD